MQAPGLESFHPIIQTWFAQRLGAPSPPQALGWPIIRDRRNVLIAAPTGSGKTLAAFLSCLDELFREALEGTLRDETRVVYVSPLKALGNDVQKNLLRPLEELTERAAAQGLRPQPVRVAVRTGDTPMAERAQMLRRPPHVLITTPESLYLCLTAERARQTLREVRTVIVDEIHALARDKRGSHLALSLERLKSITRAPPQLVGLSATQRPIERVAAFLTGRDDGGRQVPCELVQVGHLRAWELSIELPDDELSAVASHEQWGQVYERLIALSRAHRTLLVFTNTRKLAERVAHDLGERIGQDKTAAHHGSMSRELRLSAEERLKTGTLSVMVATASLELGIDIGSVDVVCQLGSPRSISVALQRIGRAGHQLGGVSRGVLFPLTRDELVECVAVVRAIREGTLDTIVFPERPLDVLAQQLVAEVAASEASEASLASLVRRADPFARLSDGELEGVLAMLSEGVSTSRGRARVHLHRDRVNGLLRPRRGARLTALLNGGAIPDTFSYPVVAEPDERVVGTLDEDFAVESSAGDIFLLGSTSWRMKRIEAGKVRVEDAHGLSPTIPFWRGEAPARTDELSAEVARLREDVFDRGATAALEGLTLAPPLLDLLERYVRAGAGALGVVPSQTVVVAERFFDEAGGMQLVLHAPFGGRINRAWGMALRKRFCRTFDFELQAAATDDGLLLSLGEQHSFPLADIFGFVTEQNVEEVLTQAVLQAPLFTTRFRWVASRALALARYRGGQRVPPILQRARAEDLLAAVFPAQVACQDNHGAGDVEIPDHPLVQESLRECLHDAMDLEGLKRVLRALKEGRIRAVAVDRPEPSVFAHQLLNSAPYTFLDEAPLEERRARAISVRRTLPTEELAGLGALDAQAISQVQTDARPPCRDVEELHDALLQLVLMPLDGAEREHLAMLDTLVRGGRAARLHRGDAVFAVAAERVPHVQALFPREPLVPPLAPLPKDAPVTEEGALVSTVRGWMETCGPTTAAELAARLALGPAQVERALARLETEGQVLRGAFRPSVAAHALDAEIEWCDRRLLQRIHRMTVGRLRAEIQPLTAQDFMRFLFRWHHVSGEDALRGAGGLAKAISLLQGYEAPAAAWEQVLLPVRMKYLPELLERACWSGEVAFCRLTPREASGMSPESGPLPRRGAAVTEGSARARIPGRTASLTFVRRTALDWMLALARPHAILSDGARALPEDLSHAARDVALALDRRGAAFFNELVASSRRLPAEVEDALWELLGRGLVTADAVENLRVLQSPKARRRQRALQRGGPGRWSLLAAHESYSEGELLERLVKLLLSRYGILFRDLAMRECLVRSWRELLLLLRRMEARGEVRGGRFIAGVAGEQFALPDAVELSRLVRRTPKRGERVVLSAVDPLNLTGIVTPGPRVPAQLGQVVVFVDGVPERVASETGLPMVER